MVCKCRAFGCENGASSYSGGFCGLHSSKATRDEIIRTHENIIKRRCVYDIIFYENIGDGLNG
jgi:hypothetical protein